MTFRGGDDRRGTESPTTDQGRAAPVSRVRTVAKLATVVAATAGLVVLAIALWNDDEPPLQALFLVICAPVLSTIAGLIFRREPAGGVGVMLSGALILLLGALWWRSDQSWIGLLVVLAGVALLTCGLLVGWPNSVGDSFRRSDRL